MKVVHTIPDLRRGWVPLFLTRPRDRTPGERCGELLVAWPRRVAPAGGGDYGTEQ